MVKGKAKFPLRHLVVGLTHFTSIVTPLFANTETIEQRLADTQQYAPDELTHPDEQGPYEGR